jgi:signal transduction histidine kinase
MQLTYARVGAMSEELLLASLVEDALRLNAAALDRHGISVILEFGETPPLSVDRHKVLQILVNLIRNAKHAMDEPAAQGKQMTLRISHESSTARISVADEGVGIPAENLARIFEHGFTTRKEGHGFGLHSAALAAKELGGSLTAHSDGAGKGAIFTLSLPLPHRSP